MNLCVGNKFPLASTKPNLVPLLQTGEHHFLGYTNICSLYLISQHYLYWHFPEFLIKSKRSLYSFFIFFHSSEGTLHPGVALLMGSRLFKEGFSTSSTFPQERKFQLLSVIFTNYFKSSRFGSFVQELNKLRQKNFQCHGLHPPSLSPKVYNPRSKINESWKKSSVATLKLAQSPALLF